MSFDLNQRPANWPVAQDSVQGMRVFDEFGTLKAGECHVCRRMYWANELVRSKSGTYFVCRGNCYNRDSGSAQPSPTSNAVRRPGRAFLL